jgi:hypothetical protein
MRIYLSPQRSDATLQISRTGNTLTLNGESFDFSLMNEGDTLPASAIKSTWFVGPVDKINGDLVLTLLLPLPPNFSPEQAFPEPLINVPDGPITLPQPLPAIEKTEARQQDAAETGFPAGELEA